MDVIISSLLRPDTASQMWCHIWFICSGHLGCFCLLGIVWIKLLQLKYMQQHFTSVMSEAPRLNFLPSAKEGGGTGPWSLVAWLWILSSGTLAFLIDKGHKSCICRITLRALKHNASDTFLERLCLTGQEALNSVTSAFWGTANCQQNS